MGIEVFLYGCEDCGLVIAIESNKGNVFYVNRCVGCNNNGKFYEKITIRPEYDMLLNCTGSRFVVEQRSCDKIKDKEENGNSNTGTDKET